jgi:ketosteroid isomerase-like protein
MKHLLAAAVSTLVFSWPNATGQPPVTAAERERADAIARHDAAAYNQLTSDDLFVVDRMGRLATKTERLIGVMGGESVSAENGEQDIDIRRFGDLAIVIGRSVWHDAERERQDYFSRIWMRQQDRWRLVAAHTTDVTANIYGPSWDSSRKDVPTLPVASAPPSKAEDGVRFAIAEQHAAYWSKDPVKYRLYAGEDLLRIAETGVRPREELIRMMRGNARLPAPPSEQRDVRVHVYGGAAVATWVDVGRGLSGAETRNRFTVVFAHRDDRWQMVHVQSNGLSPEVWKSESQKLQR